MARRTGLRTRLSRLELRASRRKPFPTIVTGIYPEEAGPIIGIEGEGKRLKLQPGETLAELQRRAAATLSGRFLRIAYGATRAAPEGASEPSPAPAPKNTPSGPAWPSVGDAGVGRVASREGLERMGALAVPIERLT